MILQSNYGERNKMTKETLLEAEKEAKRFLEKVLLLKKDNPDLSFSWSGSKRNSAVKRASMDLTRALADLRQSN